MGSHFDVMACYGTNGKAAPQIEIILTIQLTLNEIERQIKTKNDGRGMFLMSTLYD